jgi:hypothetical protein
MNTELEGFTLVLMVVLAVVMLLAATLRLIARHRVERVEREIDAEATHELAVARMRQPAR